MVSTPGKENNTNFLGESSPLESAGHDRKAPNDVQIMALDAERMPTKQHTANEKGM